MMRFYAWWATAVGWIGCLTGWVIILGADSWGEIGWYFLITLIAIGASFLGLILGLASLPKVQGTTFAKWAPVWVNLPVLAHIYLFLV